MLARVLCALVFLAAVPAAGSVVPYADRVHEARLDNGLELIVLEDHKAPVAVVQVWYRVGSRNERLGYTGLSHLLEHMMFKGTEEVGPEEYSRIVQRNGGRVNAFTSRDYTTYFATIASDRLDLVLELEADRMRNLKLVEELFGPERDVVREERRLRVETDPVSALWEKLSATAYRAHPYQWPIIGWMSDLAQSRLEDLRRYYDTCYVPNNAFVVAVGDVEPMALTKMVERHFGGIAEAPEPPAVRAVEPSQNGELRLELRREAELPYVAIAHHAPPYASSDTAALLVLEEILSGGRSSRLHRELVYRQRLARSAGAHFDALTADPGTFDLHVQPLPGVSPEEAERALLAEIEGVVQSPPTEREMQKARNALEASFVFAQDSLFYQALLLGRHEIVGDWRSIDRYLPAVRGVNPEDVVRAAETYLTPANRTVGRLVPLPPREEGE